MQQKKESKSVKELKDEIGKVTQEIEDAAREGKSTSALFEEKQKLQKKVEKLRKKKEE